MLLLLCTMDYMTSLEHIAIDYLTPLGSITMNCLARDWVRPCEHGRWRDANATEGSGLILVHECTVTRPSSCIYSRLTTSGLIYNRTTGTLICNRYPYCSLQSWWNVNHVYYSSTGILICNYQLRSVVWNVVLWIHITNDDSISDNTWSPVIKQRGLSFVIDTPIAKVGHFASVLVECESCQLQHYGDSHP